MRPSEGNKRNGSSRVEFMVGFRVLEEIREFRDRAEGWNGLENRFDEFRRSALPMKSTEKASP